MVSPWHSFRRRIPGFAAWKARAARYWIARQRAGDRAAHPQAAGTGVRSQPCTIGLAETGFGNESRQWERIDNRPAVRLLWATWNSPS
jgi:hypothetical protein